VPLTERTAPAGKPARFAWRMALRATRFGAQARFACA
jgi:hypothetical protein